MTIFLSLQVIGGFAYPSSDDDSRHDFMLDKKALTLDYGQVFSLSMLDP